MDLKDILGDIGISNDPKLLVGLDHSDDAAVYALRDDLALVQTADFITPIVDDPYVFGEIAASNALSDIFAMGAAPLTALNLCCFPHEDLKPEDFRGILEGGASKVAEAGALIVGGHTIKDKELKYGLAVNGTIHPKNIKRNSGAKEGDAILLTKPIGTGIVTTAAKKSRVESFALKEAIETMSTLNKTASRLAVEANASTMTDVTGFGLAVHSLEVARASNVRMKIFLNEVPFLKNARELSKAGIKTGMAFANEQSAFGQIEFASSLTREEQLLAYDPQTSGGLLIFIPEAKADELLEKLKDKAETSKSERMGTVTGSGKPFLEIG